MDLELPDGTVVQGIPDGLSKAQITNKLVASGYAKSLASPEDVAMANPVKDMSGPERFMAGMGGAFSGIGHGVQQLFGGGPSPEEVRQQREQDKPLMATPGGLFGNIAGNVAATIPAAAIPGANTALGATLIGAGLNAVQPAESGQERLLNTGVGAAGGLGGNLVGRALGKLIQPVKGALNPEEARLAQVATQEGIPLTAADATGSKPLKILGSVLENMPLTSGSQLEREGAKQTAFNRAVLSRGGITGEDLATPQVLGAQKSGVGSQLGAIAGSNKLDFNQGLTTKLANIVDDASQHLPPAKANEIASQVDQILSQVDQSGNMLGSNYQGWRQPLNALAKKGDEYASYYGNIKKALDTAFRDQLPGAEGDNFRQLSSQYANLKTIIPAMSGSAPGVVAGNVAPTQLGSALAQAMGREGKALGRGDLNDIQKVGALFIRKNLPDSGTAQRALIQSMVTGGVGAGGGALGAMATGHDPGQGALYGAGAMGTALIAPKLAQALLNNPQVQSYIIKQSTNPNAQKLARVLMMSATLGGAALPASIGQ